MSTPETNPVGAVHRYRTIEAWRGVAALGVLFFHSVGSVEGQPIWAPLEPVRRIAGQGWLGLHLFFVISGYCIFERLSAARARGDTVREFWVDRFLRIYPTYWAILAFTLALNLVTCPFNRTTWTGNLPPSFSAALADLTLTHVLGGSPPYVLVSWTLTCEVSFYLLAGLILACSRNFRGLLPSWALGAVLCVLATRMPSDRWTLPLALWPDFFAGACVSLALRAASSRDRWLQWASLGTLVALTGCALGRVGNYGSEAHRVAFGFAWLLLALYRWDRLLDGMRPVRLFSLVGTFSYSLYLIHVQILSRVLNLGTRMISPASAGFGALWLTAVAAAIAAGWYFWRIVELRCEGYRNRRKAGARRMASPVVPVVVGPA